MEYVGQVVPLKEVGMAGPPPNDRGRYEQMLRDMVGGGRAPSPSPRVHLRPNRSLREMGRTTPAVRTPHFLAFLVLLSLCVIGVSLYIFKVSNGSYGLVGFCLSLLLLLVCVVANGSGSSRDPISRSILNITGLASFVSCFALLALPDVHQVIYHLTLTQLVSGMIVVAAIFSVVRPTNRLGNVTLAALAGTCAVLQYAYGRQEDFRYIPFLSPDAYALTNNVLVWTLVAVAVLALLLGVADSPKLNQTVVLVVASIYAMFQFSFGYQEILHTFSLQTNSSSAVISAIYLNMVLVYGPIIVTLLVLLFARQSPRLEQSPMLAPIRSICRASRTRSARFFWWCWNIFVNVFAISSCRPVPQTPRMTG